MAEETENISKNEQERKQRLAASRKRMIKKILIWIVGLAVLSGGVYGLVEYSRKLSSRKPGVAILELAQDHIPVGSKRPDYNSNPPTSGPHYPNPANWGIYDKPLPDEQLVHNLEHGGVWISYRDPGDQELIGKLKELAGKYSLKVIMTPRPENDSAIAVAAWGRLLKLDTFDKAKIQEFIDAFINRGPEQVPY